jgi:dTDP-4-dehydrorhamnose reductase
MTILIIGSNGQLGRELQALSAEFPSLKLVPIDRSSLDVSDTAAIAPFCNSIDFDVCINCAAYTAVDKAEQEKELAFAINAEAPAQLAAACSAKGAQLIHYSSDYVYHNQENRPLLETDATTPQGIYAQSKLEGDLKVLATYPGALVFRTSWVYSSFGHNFVKTMLRYGAERGALRVVNDQIGSPTYARDIARMTLELIQSGQATQHSGLFNYSNEGVCSWYDFAQAIFELSGVKCKVEAIPSTEYPTPAARPHYSVLDKGKFKAAFGAEVPYWRDSLKDCLELLGY